MSNSISPSGKLPDFIIVGAMKSGTSSLQYHLRKHPRVEMAPNLTGMPGDEPHFFTQNQARGLEWYRSLFNANGKLQSEKTPTYLPQHCSHGMIRQVIPDCKLVAILRDPVDRVESQFNHFVQDARSNPANPPGWDGWNPWISFEENYRSVLEGRQSGGFIHQGCYVEHLESLFLHFPREQVLILITEEYRLDPAATLRQLFEFLGIDPVPVPHNPRVHARTRDTQISREHRALLREYYEPFNCRLFKLLGRQITQWSGRTAGD